MVYNLTHKWLNRPVINLGRTWVAYLQVDALKMAKMRKRRKYA